MSEESGGRPSVRMRRRSLRRESRRALSVGFLVVRRVSYWVRREVVEGGLVRVERTGVGWVGLPEGGRVEVPPAEVGRLIVG